MPFNAKCSRHAAARGCYAVRYNRCVQVYVINLTGGYNQCVQNPLPLDFPFSRACLEITLCSWLSLSTLAEAGALHEVHKLISASLLPASPLACRTLFVRNFAVIRTCLRLPAHFSPHIIEFHECGITLLPICSC